MKALGYNSRTSWIALLACTVIGFFIVLPMRLSGLFYVIIIDRYRTDRELATLPIVIFGILRTLTGPFTGYLGQVFGFQAVTMIGCLLSALGIGFCYFAEDIIAVASSLGLIYGFGLSFGNTLVPNILKLHFSKDINLINGLYLTGSCLGAVIMSPIIQYLSKSYGDSGMFLILSGIVLNCVPAALLLKNPNNIEEEELEVGNQLDKKMEDIFHQNLAFVGDSKTEVDTEIYANLQRNNDLMFKNHESCMNELNNGGNIHKNKEFSVAAKPNIVSATTVKDKGILHRKENNFQHNFAVDMEVDDINNKINKHCQPVSNVENCDENEQEKDKLSSEFSKKIRQNNISLTFLDDIKTFEKKIISMNNHNSFVDHGKYGTRKVAIINDVECNDNTEVESGKDLNKYEDSRTNEFQDTIIKNESKPNSLDYDACKTSQFSLRDSEIKDETEDSKADESEDVLRKNFKSSTDHHETNVVQFSLSCNEMGDSECAIKIKHNQVSLNLIRSSNVQLEDKTDESHIDMPECAVKNNSKSDSFNTSRHSVVQFALGESEIKVETRDSRIEEPQEVKNNKPKRDSVELVRTSTVQFSLPNTQIGECQTHNSSDTDCSKNSKSVTSKRIRFEESTRVKGRTSLSKYFRYARSFSVVEATAFDYYKKSQPTNKLARLFTDATFYLIMIVQSSHAFITTLNWTIIIDYARDRGIDVLYISWADNFMQIMIGIILFGVLSGALLTTFPGIIFEFVDRDLQNMAMASRYVFYTFLCLSKSPVVGYFRGTLGSYTYIYYILAGLCTVCAFFTKLTPVLVSFRQRNKEI
nr:uncharacterized protein LOC107447797 isoform X2 [Parasteatoda tepidariorum]